MKKLAIVLGTIVLFFGAACGSDNSDKTSEWSAREKAALHAGIEDEMINTLGFGVPESFTDCVVDYVVSHYSPDELIEKSTSAQVEVGEKAGKFCSKKTGYTG